jgi:4-hydroxy-3-methylbut-2-en-1-yl diphosphate reductase
MAAMQIEISNPSGFCFGVQRALKRVRQQAAGGGVETLGAVVHNQGVLDELAGEGVRAVSTPEAVRGPAVVTSAHGVSPETLVALNARGLEIVDTTCPYVRRAQKAARKMARAGFYVVVYGDAEHPEVKGILGWAGGGIATLDTAFLRKMEPLPRRIGVVSQTTQVPQAFQGFIHRLIDLAFGQDSEVWCVDTICHDIRQRQAAALELAGRVDLMLVVGGQSSANTRHLAALCGDTTATHHITDAANVEPSWFGDKVRRVGIVGGASTPEVDLTAVRARLIEITSE